MAEPVCGDVPLVLSVDLQAPFQNCVLGFDPFLKRLMDLLRVLLGRVWQRLGEYLV